MPLKFNKVFVTKIAFWQPDRRPLTADRQTIEVFRRSSVKWVSNQGEIRY